MLTYLCSQGPPPTVYTGLGSGLLSIQVPTGLWLARAQRLSPWFFSRCSAAERCGLGKGPSTQWAFWITSSLIPCPVLAAFMMTVSGAEFWLTEKKKKAKASVLDWCFSKWGPRSSVTQFQSPLQTYGIRNCAAAPGNLPLTISQWFLRMLTIENHCSRTLECWGQRVNS